MNRAPMLLEITYSLDMLDFDCPHFRKIHHSPFSPNFFPQSLHSYGLRPWCTVRMCLRKSPVWVKTWP